MQIVSFSEASTNLDVIFNKVFFDNEEVVMHKENGQNVVVISFDEYSSIKETSYLFASPNNKERLMRSLKDLREGKGIARDIIE